MFCALMLDLLTLMASVCELPLRVHWWRLSCQGVIMFIPNVLATPVTVTIKYVIAVNLSCNVNTAYVFK